MAIFGTLPVHDIAMRQSSPAYILISAFIGRLVDFLIVARAIFVAVKVIYRLRTVK